MDRVNEVNKLFIIWLFEEHSGDEPNGWHAAKTIVMLQSFSLRRPRPNGSKFNELHVETVKCNVKFSFLK